MRWKNDARTSPRGRARIVVESGAFATRLSKSGVCTASFTSNGGDVVCDEKVKGHARAATRNAFIFVQDTFDSAAGTTFIVVEDLFSGEGPNSALPAATKEIKCPFYRRSVEGVTSDDEGRQRTCWILCGACQKICPTARLLEVASHSGHSSFMVLRVEYMRL